MQGRQWRAFGMYLICRHFQIYSVDHIFKIHSCVFIKMQSCGLDVYQVCFSEALKLVCFNHLSG